jgi:hydroxymethylpyrimidine pyrophosphatase-like HAD family hydrolase
MPQVGNRLFAPNLVHSIRRIRFKCYPLLVEPILISTDFDGTIFDHESPSPFASSFMDWIRCARKKRRIVWVINTGRDWESLLPELNRCPHPLWPDWVALIEREIHRVHNGDPHPHHSWNNTCTEIHADLFERARPAFEKTRRELSAFRDLAIVNDIGSPLGLIASNDEQADEVERAIAPLLDEFPDMHVVRNSIYFRFAHVDYHKGSCLGMIASEERIAPEQCFAAGDHHNDVPMLDRKYAHAIACPSNSDPRVIDCVTRQKGFVAKQPAGEGVAEALIHFFGDPSQW